MIGTTLGHFRITAELGEGGMGVVYQAEDIRLRRKVAVKLLPAEFTADAERLARFQREAQILAALNHPGIVAVHSLETADADHGAVDFLVMELVEGETLGDLIDAGNIALETFFDLAIPLAETLAAAHERGIIHRDLKPGNIMVSTSGAIKVLDFGLAKQSSEDAEAMTELTRANQVLGTVPYMSPEQVRGQPLDIRSDLFSLGVILFEILAGKRPFQGQTAADLAVSILQRKPMNLTALRPGTPQSIVDLVLDCLAKDRDERVQTAGELRDRLRELRAADQESRNEDTVLLPSGMSSQQGLDQRAVAVLPFTNLSGSDEAEFLAVGLHSDVLTELSKIVGLTVISRTSVMGYRETDTPAVEIGRRLNAGTIVTGTVQSAGRRVRMTAQLIDASSDVQRWAERYDEDLSPESLFDIQTGVTNRIISSLQSELLPDLEPPEAKAPAKDLEAYRLNTLGSAQLDRRTEAGCRRAIEHFEAAVKRDPEAPSAWAGLARALAITVWYGYAKRQGLLPRAEEAALRAIELDPDSAEANVALATYYGTDRNGPAAMKRLNRAVELQPSHAEAYNKMSYLSSMLGRADEAFANATRAVALDPLSAEVVVNVALSSLITGRAEQALTEAQRAIELSPGWTTAEFIQSLALYDLGSFPEARSSLSGLSLEWAGLGVPATDALAALAMGDEPVARESLGAMDPAVDPFAVGLVHLALGEIDDAFQLLLKAETLSDWACLAVHHLYRNTWATIHGDQRYDELTRKAWTTWDYEPPVER